MYRDFPDVEIDDDYGVNAYEFDVDDNAVIDFKLENSNWTSQTGMVAVGQNYIGNPAGKTNAWAQTVGSNVSAMDYGETPATG
ncbi:hypothetical protein ACFLQ8_00515 [Candidatus Auribacterota bacterium]